MLVSIFQHNSCLLDVLFLIINTTAQGSPNTNYIALLCWSSVRFFKNFPPVVQLLATVKLNMVERFIVGTHGGAS